MTLLRARGSTRVSNTELLFDLVYVFAVTQLSHQLISHPTVEGALQTLILFGFVWEAWAYTMWATNWLDPDRLPVRIMLFATAFASLVVSLAIPDAFTNRGWALAGAYATMQIGRLTFAAIALRPDRGLQRNYQRILCWCLLSGGLALIGAAAHGHAREWIWAGAVFVDVLAGTVGLYVPGLGRSSTRDWTIDGAHLAERCHAFVLIALGESIVVLGATISALSHIGGTEITVLIAGFLGVIGLWWIYFARTAESAAEVIATASDPGRYGRAYHEVHPIMIAGIIVIAAADELVLRHPLHATRATTWTILGGTILFVGGHAIFKAYLWRVRPWSRIIAVAILIALLPVGPHIAPIALAAVAVAITLGVCVDDAVFTATTRKG